MFSRMRNDNRLFVQRYLEADRSKQAQSLSKLPEDYENLLPTAEDIVGRISFDDVEDVDEAMGDLRGSLRMHECLRTSSVK